MCTWRVENQKAPLAWRLRVTPPPQPDSHARRSHLDTLRVAVCASDQQRGVAVVVRPAQVRPRFDEKIEAAALAHRARGLEWHRTTLIVGLFAVGRRPGRQQQSRTIGVAVAAGGGERAVAHRVHTLNQIAEIVGEIAEIVGEIAGRAGCGAGRCVGRGATATGGAEQLRDHVDASRMAAHACSRERRDPVRVRDGGGCAVLEQDSHAARVALPARRQQRRVPVVGVRPVERVDVQCAGERFDAAARAARARNE